nr:hypothetical protein [Tanacetum cinerariifolium]
MTSFGYRLNPRYAIKECLSCGALYTRNCSCSKGNIEDKILVPKPSKNCARCAKCGHPVNGPYCQGCALLRQELEENLATHSPDFQNTSDQSNASTNVVNAPREPYVVKQDNGNVLRDGEACKRCTCAKSGSGLGKGHCYICRHNQNSLNDSPSIFETSSQSPPNIDHCCYECGDPLDGIFCKQCTCKSCGKGAHIGYNCPPKVLIIPNPKPCNNQTIDELPQALLVFHPTFHSEAESPFTLDSTPTYVDESPNVFNPPLQPPVYPCEFCGNDARYGHYCTPQAQFNNPEQGYSQDLNFPQNIHNSQQQYLCCAQCGGLHETFQCQQVIFYEPCCENCGDLMKPFSVNQRMKIIAMSKILAIILTPLVMTIKQEEKRIKEEQATKARYWKIPACCDDDDNYDSAITPILSTEEPIDSLSMRDEHLDTILATESDELIKSSVENLVPNP